MKINLPKLPAGVQEFDIIRRENQLYVDKTGFIPLLEKNKPIVFLARPR